MTTARTGTRLPGGGLRRTNGRAVDLALAVALALLTLAVALGWWPVSVDYAVERALPQLGAGGVAGVLLHLAGRLTALAAPTYTVAATLVVATVLGLARHSLAPVRFTGVRVAVLTGTVLAGKALLHRPGPLRAHPGVGGLHGYFPSGHTATALVCTTTVAALLAQHRPAWRRPAYGLAGAWTALVGTGLVLHRYHWPTDVLGALLLGGLILLWTPRYAG